MRMQEKFSAGNDCLQFPQLTIGNLPALARKLREASTMRVRLDFFKPSNNSYYPVPNNLIKVNITVFKVNDESSETDFVQSKVDC